MKTMQYIFSRVLPSRSCLLLLVLLLPAIAMGGAVTDNQSFTILQEQPVSSHLLYSTAQHAQHANSAMPYRSSLRGQSMMSGSWQMVDNAGAGWQMQSVPATQVRISEIGASVPFEDTSAADNVVLRPRRADEDDDIGEPGPVGDVPFALMLLLCGAWMWLRRRKTA